MNDTITGAIIGVTGGIAGSLLTVIWSERLEKKREKKELKFKLISIHAMLLVLSQKLRYQAKDVIKTSLLFAKEVRINGHIADSNSDSIEINIPASNNSKESRFRYLQERYNISNDEFLKLSCEFVYLYPVLIDEFNECMNLLDKSTFHLRYGTKQVLMSEDYEAVYDEYYKKVDAYIDEHHQAIYSRIVMSFNEHVLKL